MSAPSVGGLTSVIVPYWNQLEFTRKCIWALMCRTAANWNLIVVDNGSTDGRGSYLCGVQDAPPVPVIVIAIRNWSAASSAGRSHMRGSQSFLARLYRRDASEAVLLCNPS
jgi:hypothetical protein